MRSRGRTTISANDTRARRRVRVSVHSFWTYLAALVVSAAAASASELELSRYTDPEFSTAELSLLRDLDDGTLTDSSLLDAALTATGHTDRSKRADYEARLAAIAHQLKAAAKDPHATQTTLATRLLERLHAEILTGQYRVDASNLGATFQSGDYNCLSAALLFLELCHRTGLDALPIAAPGHIACRLRTPAGPLHIEPTCADWFDVQNDPDRVRRALAEINQADPRSLEPTRTFRELNDAQLLAVVYYNLGVAHLAHDRFPHAITANVAATRLDPLAHSAQRNLRAAVNNWALELYEQQRFDDALILLQQARDWDPEFAAFRDNHRIIARHAAAKPLPTTPTTPTPAQASK